MFIFLERSEKARHGVNATAINFEQQDSGF